jgi:hypothetical protein
MLSPMLERSMPRVSMCSAGSLMRMTSSSPMIPYCRVMALCSLVCAEADDDGADDADNMNCPASLVVAGEADGSGEEEGEEGGAAAEDEEEVMEEEDAAEEEDGTEAEEDDEEWGSSDEEEEGTAAADEAEADEETINPAGCCCGGCCGTGFVLLLLLLRPPLPPGVLLPPPPFAPLAVGGELPELGSAGKLASLRSNSTACRGGSPPNNAAPPPPPPALLLALLTVVATELYDVGCCGCLGGPPSDGNSFKSSEMPSRPIMPPPPTTAPPPPPPPPICCCIICCCIICCCCCCCCCCGVISCLAGGCRFTGTPPGPSGGPAIWFRTSGCTIPMGACCGDM